ncbi:MAG: ABC transporter substrate-binding protein [Candidatus Bipolaricaulota bacterium]
MRILRMLAIWMAGLGLAAAASPLTVVLDYLPNANHAPLYLAAEGGSFSAEGLAVDFWIPANASDPVKLVAAGAADLALTPQINYLMARAEGLPLVAVGALIDQPLGGLLALAESGVAAPADLAGRPIGYSLAPLEPALWRTMLECAGVSPRAVDLVNVGFNAVQALLTGSVAAIGAFRNVELLQVELLGRAVVFFPEEDFCVPATFDLLWVARSDVLAARGDEVRGFLAAVDVAVEVSRAAPDEALTALFGAFPELDDELSRRSFAATIPLYADGLRHDDEATWDAVQRFLVAQGLMQEPLPYADLVDTTFLPMP